MKWEKNFLISSAHSAWPALAESIVQATESLQVAASSMLLAAVPRLVFQAH